MAHFAHITNGIVDQVIVIDAETLATGHWGDPSEWVQTSYNTQGNQHPEGRPLNKNYAGIGYTWDGTGFAPPKVSKIGVNYNNKNVTNNYSLQFVWFV